MFNFSFSNLRKEVQKTEQYLEKQANTPNEGKSNFMTQAQKFLDTAEKEIQTGQEDISLIDQHIVNLEDFKAQRQDDLTLMQNFTNNVRKLFTNTDAE